MLLFNPTNIIYHSKPKYVEYVTLYWIGFHRRFMSETTNCLFQNIILKYYFNYNSISWILYLVGAFSIPSSIQKMSQEVWIICVFLYQVERCFCIKYKIGFIEIVSSQISRMYWNIIIIHTQYDSTLNLHIFKFNDFYHILTSKVCIRFVSKDCILLLNFIFIPFSTQTCLFDM